MQFYYSFMREQKQGQISCVADKDAYIQKSTMDEGGKKRAELKRRQEENTRRLVITSCEVWFLAFRLERFEDSLYLRKATQLSIISSMKLVPVAS